MPARVEDALAEEAGDLLQGGGGGVGLGLGVFGLGVLEVLEIERETQRERAHLNVISSRGVLEKSILFRMSYCSGSAPGERRRRRRARRLRR